MATDGNEVNQFRTSTEIGHAYRASERFPSANFQRTFDSAFSETLCSPTQVRDRYSTTTGAAHDYKPPFTIVANQLHRKAPGSWKVDYVDDTIGKLQLKPWRQPLTMGNQSSEMKSQYIARPGINMSRHFCNDIQPPLYRHHQNDGPLKELVPSTQNKNLARKEYIVSDKGVLTFHLDPYLTTTQRNHRAFTREERMKGTQPTQATYWECEDYPKAWGYGGKVNLLPSDSIPIQHGIMRDRTLFPMETTVPRTPKGLQPVPHRGLTSEMMANYTMPDKEKRNTLFQKLVHSPWELKVPGPDEILSIPKMYQTEYQYYGSEVPVVV